MVGSTSPHVAGSFSSTCDLYNFYGFSFNATIIFIGKLEGTNSNCCYVVIEGIFAWTSNGITAHLQNLIEVHPNPDKASNDPHTF